MKQSFRNFILLVVCALLIGNFICAEAVDVGHGEECNNKDKICKDSAFLECNSESQCACKSPDTTFYDSKDKICKIKSDEKCSTDAGAQPCIAQSSCAPRGGPTGELLCTCYPHLEGKRGQCFLPFGPDCSEESLEKCDEDSFTFCNIYNKQKFCSCKEDENIWYSEKTKSCVLLVNSECTEGEKEQQCVEGAKCVLGKCECENGAKNTTDRLCVAYFEEPCGRTNDKKCSTDDFLECVGGKCACEGENKARYDSKSEKCMLLPGSECNTKGQPCAALSDCPKDGGVCTCKDELTVNKNKECTLDYGLNCAEKPPGWTCDSTDFLDCNKETRKCDCKNPADSLYEDGVCKARAGKICGMNDYSQECVVGAKCQYYGGSFYTCQCNSPLQPSKTNLCVRSYDSSCGFAFEGDCDKEAFQKCNNGKCGCEDPDDMVYGLNNLCYLKKGVKCKEGDENPSCELGLLCGTDGKCGCNTTAGFEDDGEGECRKPYGAPCKMSEGPEGLCDMENFFMCYQGECYCNDSHQEKEQGKGKPCVGKKNAQCNSDANCNSDLDLICKDRVCAPSTSAGIYLNGILSILALFVSLR